MLQGAEGTINFMDDIVITGKNSQEHLKNLETVFERLDKAGFKLNLSKCKFFESQIRYLGHIIDKKGLHKDPDKIKAIVNAPRPSDQTGIKAFIGMVNYYGKFIPHLSSLLDPLYRLLRKDVTFEWSETCETAFIEVKNAILSEQNLAYFDPKLPLKLVCDASKIGLGAVLLHVFPDGLEKPVSFISRTLSKAELNYSVIHKEALCIFWAVKKFYQYLSGNKFILCSDHKPLLALFGENKGIPQMAAGRLQRWAFFLSGFDYSFQYVKGCQNGGADGLSRLPLKVSDNTEKIDFDYFNFLVEDKVPVSAEQIRKELRTDKVLSRVYRYTRDGWPEEPMDEDLKPFKRRHLELSIDQDVLMWGFRVIIPSRFRAQILAEIHGAHNGMVKMKALARQYVWWPNLDIEIEQYVKRCDACMVNSKTPNKVPLTKFDEAKHVFDRIHIDFLGPFRNRMFLVIIDAYSKWPEVYEMSSTDSCKTLEKLRDCFSKYGLPNLIISDNGSQLVSEEFETFCINNRISHRTSPTYHPATNGAAENMVKMFKNSLTKYFTDHSTKHESISNLVSKFLFSYRNTPHCATGEMPSKLMFNRKVKTRLDFLSSSKREKARQDQIKYHYGNREVGFEEGELVYTKDYRNSNKPSWVKAIIIGKLGHKTFVCQPEGEEGLRWKRHIDQIIQIGRFYDDVEVDVLNKQMSGICNNSLIDNTQNLALRNDLEDPCIIDNVTKNKESGVEPKAEGETKEQNDHIKEAKVSEDMSGTKNVPSALSRPKRVVKPPDRLNL